MSVTTFSERKPINVYCMYIFPFTKYYLQNLNRSKYIYNDQ